jgi:hypothetical protein
MDFSRITLNEDRASKTLTVSLPPAKLLSVVPDRDSFTVYYEGKNMFNALHLEETNEAEKAAEAEIKEADEAAQAENENAKLKAEKAAKEEAKETVEEK